MENSGVIARGAANIYLETVVGVFSGYVLWFLLTRLTTAEIIGTSSAIISIATIFAVVVSIGINQGVQRFSAKSFAEKRLQDSRIIVLSSLALLLVGIFFGVASMIIFKDLIYAGGLVDSLVILSIFLVVCSAFAALFRSVVVSFLYTGSLPKIMVLSSIAKIVLAILLILAGLGAAGIILAYIFTQAMAAVYLGLTTFRFLKVSNLFKKWPVISLCREILIASIPSWIPALINVIGIQLGTLVVYGFEGATQAGVYIIAFSLFSGITAIINSVFAIAFPALCAMHDGRKRAISRLIKITLVVSLPLSSSIIIYSEDIITVLFGRDYVGGSLALNVFLLSIFPSTIVIAINALVYAYGRYWYLLAIGLGLAIPRTVFYFVFVLFYGSFGAAAAYTLGTFTGFVISLVIAKKIGLVLAWKEFIPVFILPLIVGFVMYSLQIHFIIATAITFAISHALFLKLRILERSDIKDVVDVLPGRLSRPILSTIDILDKKLNRQ